MNPLEQMKDIHLPAEVSLWPFAYGWWLLLIIVVTLLILFIKWAIKTRRQNLAKRQALIALSAITEKDNWPQQINALLKRTALSYFEPERIASLHTESWVSFLCEQVDNSQKDSICQAFTNLQAGLYANQPDNIDFDTCWEATRQWILIVSPNKQQKLTPDGGSHV